MIPKKNPFLCRFLGELITRTALRDRLRQGVRRGTPHYPRDQFVAVGIFVFGRGCSPGHASCVGQHSAVCRQGTQHSLLTTAVARWPKSTRSRVWEAPRTRLCVSRRSVPWASLSQGLTAGQDSSTSSWAVLPRMWYALPHVPCSRSDHHPRGIPRQVEHIRAGSFGVALCRGIESK